MLRTIQLHGATLYTADTDFKIGVRSSVSIHLDISFASSLSRIGQVARSTWVDAGRYEGRGQPNALNSSIPFLISGIAVND
jgi:deoxycytidine triphosphate deaminase